MSGIKEVLLAIQINHMTFHVGMGEYEPMCKFCVDEKASGVVSEEEKIMARYDHVRADELNSTDRQEVEE